MSSHGRENDTNSGQLMSDVTKTTSYFSGRSGEHPTRVPSFRSPLNREVTNTVQGTVDVNETGRGGGVTVSWVVHPEARGPIRTRYGTSEIMAFLSERSTSLFCLNNSRMTRCPGQNTVKTSVKVPIRFLRLSKREG